MSKKPLFSLTKKDFDVQTFRAGGKGGQHQNKKDSAVRIVHKDSGAVGECRNFRSQHKNKEEAFNRLVASHAFRRWHSVKCLEIMNKQESPEKRVERWMHPDNIRIEIRDEEGRWASQ